MSTAIRVVNLGLRFALELCALAALGVWGWSAGPTLPFRLLLALGACGGTTDDAGENVPGFQVHLGGGRASPERDEAGLGRTVRGLKVQSADLADYVERVVRRFVEQCTTGESFATWAHRATDEELT